MYLVNINSIFKLILISNMKSVWDSVYWEYRMPFGASGKTESFQLNTILQPFVHNKTILFTFILRIRSS